MSRLSQQQGKGMMGWARCGVLAGMAIAATGVGCGAEDGASGGLEEGAMTAEAEAALTSLPTPVGHWKLDETSGTSAADASGNNAHGTRVNGAAWTTDGRIGGAAVFDGVDDRIEVADRSSFHFTTAMTASAWVRPSRSNGAQTIVNKWYVPDSYMLLLQDGSYRFAISLSNGQNITVTAPATVGVWAHVAGVFDGATAKLYVNGALVASASAVGTLRDSSQPLRIGNHPSWNAYAGRIDDVRLYGSALSTQQIQHLATALKKKVAVIRYDPYVAPGQRLTAALNWPDESARSQQLVDKLATVTQDYVNYRIVEDVVIDAFPQKMDGFRYTWSSYQACRSNPANCHMPDDASYAAMMADYQAATATSLCTKISSGAVDEVWVWGGDYFGFDEFAFKIPNDQPKFAPTPANDWIYNLRKKDLPACGKTYFVMGYNPVVGFDNMMHSYGHRIESAMTISPAAKGYWQRCNQNSAWTKFLCINQNSAGQGSCGDVHYPVNATSDYMYGNTTAVPSSCDAWSTFPNVDLTQKPSTGCSAWGCTQEGYLTYWMAHIPKNPGNDQNGYYNWWRYIVDYDVVYQPLP